MNLQIIPFGKGNCEFTRDRRHIGLVICIQGLKNLEEAYQRCLSRLSPRTQFRLKQCAQTQTGECLATGICCCGITCMPAPAMVCNPASCQPGYTCGHYGCARNKARSALTKKLQQMYFKRDPCPIAAATDIQYCAAQGRDHIRCCAKVGIASTLAGNKCKEGEVEGLRGYWLEG
uniref:Uncharacterized protein n=1 Tax=Meloidogyne javanica TaxID=6303 RepID=A0A915M471_MELJA